MRVEVTCVSKARNLDLPIMSGDWAWLLFNDDGALIAYSDGYPSASACTIALKQIEWFPEFFRETDSSLPE